MEKYVSISIETHLFFSRIMKEHALFLEAGFPCQETEWIRKAEWFRKQFEEILRQALRMSGGRVRADILDSQEIVTRFTIPAEKRTVRLTGIPIDSNISAAEQQLIPARRRTPACRGESACEEHRTACAGQREERTMCPDCKEHRRPEQEFQILSRNAGFREAEALNERAIRLLDGLIGFKEAILREVNSCRLYTANYPLLIQHILREAKLYRSILEELRRNKCISENSLREKEDFWNQIMMEHALFIRGLLDPTENQLIETADGFAAEYAELLELAKSRDCKASENLTRKSLEETLRYREFKTAGAEGILGCQIASLILPLLADHVLREANHYIRILESGCEGREE